MESKRWFVGVDWATEEHFVCLIDDKGKILGERTFLHSGTGILEMCTWLMEKSGADSASQLHVAIEVPHGAVVTTMLEQGMLVHSINPKQLDRFRDRFTVAGAKDDRRDAHVLADSLRTDSLRTDGSCFRPLLVDEPLIIELREWSRIDGDLKKERVALSNRMRQQIHRYYPQLLELVGADITSPYFLGLWELIPTPAMAAKARKITVSKYLLTTQVRRLDADEVLQTLRQKPLTVAPGTTEAAVAHIKLLIARLRLINEQLKETARELERLADAIAAASKQKGEQRDVDILRTLPGLGKIVLATLLAEGSRPLAERNYHTLRLLSGAAPVTKSSGKRKGNRAIVGMRQACNYRLRNALHFWASGAIRHDPTSHDRYAALRARGKTHGRALRTIGDHLLKVACAMLRNQTPYDPTLRLAALKSKELTNIRGQETR